MSNKKIYILFALLSLLIITVFSCQKSTISQLQESSKIKVVVISDLNSQYGSTEYEPEIDKAIALIVTQWKPNLVLGGGDAIAGQKLSITDEGVKAMWESFDLHVAKPLRESNIPYAFTIGNHDGSGAIKQQQFIFQRDRNFASQYWNDPQHNSPIDFVDKANFPFYYSFQQQGIFYLVWDASTNRIDDKQLQWVERTLNTTSAKEAILKIAIGHLPLYPIATKKNKPGEYLADADKLRLLLEKYQVSTYISGHHHAYYPGKKNKLQLLYAGALGQGARQLIDSNLPPRNTITEIAISAKSQTITYTTYDIKTLAKIENSELPRSIAGQNGLVLRQDVNLQDLTALGQL